MSPSSHDHAYFFLGNCQTQYLCSVVGAVSGAERYMLGLPFNVNVTLEGAHVPYVRGREFQAAARAAKARGARTILLVQDTLQRRYHDRIGGWGDLFSDVLLIPHLHHRAVWPGHALDKPIEEISDRSIRRLADWERHEFRTKLLRAKVEPSPFEDAYWEANRQALRFYHPGHPRGAVFAEVLQALGPEFEARLPCFEPLVRKLSRALGIYQTCSHPIHPRAAAVHRIEWAQTPFYQAWTALKFGNAAALRASVDAATEILNAPEVLGEQEVPLQAHFRAAVGTANLKLERRNRAMRQLSQAVIELKGFHPLLRVALNQTMRAGRYDMVEHMLVEVAPHVVGFRNEGAGIAVNLKALHSRPEGRATLQRVRDQIGPETWMHRTLAAMGDAP